MHDSRSSSVDHLSFSPVGKKSGADTISESSRSFSCDRGWGSFNLCSDIEKSVVPLASPSLHRRSLNYHRAGHIRHIPNLDEQDPTPNAKKPTPSPLRDQSNLIRQKIPTMSFPDNDNSHLNTEGVDASILDLDLSTSRVATEVMDAMMVKDVLTANDWLNGAHEIVVNDVGGSSPPREEGTGE